MAERKQDVLLKLKTSESGPKDLRLLKFKAVLLLKSL